jgi:actin-related protein 8
MYVDKNIPSAVMAPPEKAARLLGTPMPATKSKLLGLAPHLTAETDGTPRSSVAGSPPPEDIGTPQPAADGADAEAIATVQGAQPDTEIIDRTVPIMPLEQAILTSIQHASGSDDRKRRDFLGSIMLVGGGSKIHNLGAYLEARLRAQMPQYPKEILVGTPPREMDPAVTVWKGGSVFGKLRMTNDSWIGALEYDRLGSRILNYKCMWHW